MWTWRWGFEIFNCATEIQQPPKQAMMTSGDGEKKGGTDFMLLSFRFHITTMDNVSFMISPKIESKSSVKSPHKEPRNNVGQRY